MLDSGETISHIAIFRLHNRIRTLKVLTCKYIPYWYEYYSTRMSTRVLYAIFWVNIFNRYSSTYDVLNTVVENNGCISLSSKGTLAYKFCQDLAPIILYSHLYSQ